MGTVVAYDPQSQQNLSFSNTGQLHEAIKTYHVVPLRPEGTPYITQEFAGGYLLDGAPLNVYIEGLWFAGQKELLAAEWAANRVPRPSDAVLNIGVVPMPPDVQANWEASQSTGGIFGAIPTPVLVGGAALLAWKFLK